MQQQGEFVATHARHGVVIVDATEQPRGHFLEHAIAGGVAQGVVDRFEAVEVEEHQHHPGLLPVGRLQCRVQTILEQRAVGQVGQGVVIGEAVNPLFTGLALADVTEETHIACQIAFVVQHRGDPDPRRVMLAVAALEPDFAFPGAVLMQLLEHITQMGFLLVVDGEHVRQLVEHLLHGITADATERFVGLDDVTGRVGDQDRRGRVFKNRGRHAQVFLGPALLADIATDAQHAFECSVFVPHQHQPQFDRNLAAVSPQAVEQKQLGLHLTAQQRQLLGFIQRFADPVHQVVNAAQLLRVGDGRLPAVLEYPVDVVTQHSLHRRADVIERHLAVGGENHVADAFGEHPVTLLAVAQGFAGFDLLGDVLGHADDPRDLIVLVPRQGLFANLETPPFAVPVTEAQLALQQLPVTGVPLDLARTVVEVGVFGVQEDFPEVLAHLVQLGAVVAECLAQVVVAEDHSLADHVLHIQVIRHGAHDVGPESFTLQQRQFDELAAGDVGDAQDHRFIVVLVFRQAQYQPQVLVAAVGVLEFDFQFKLLLMIEHRFKHLIADG